MPDVTLTDAEAKVAVYDFAKRKNGQAAGPTTYKIGNRKDAFAVISLFEEKGKALTSVLYLVYRDRDGELGVEEIKRVHGLQFWGVREERGSFIFEILGGDGIEEIKISLEPRKLDPSVA